MAQRTIMAYEMDDGRNFVGRPFYMNEKLKTCKLRDGCMIRKENLPGKNYDEEILEIYSKSMKQDIVQFGLEKVIKSRQLILKE